MENDNISKNEKNSRKSIAYDIYEWIESLLLPIIFVVVIMAFFVRISKVDGESMLPTLHHNDYLLISRFMYEPDYNDIIVLQASGVESDEQYEEGKPIVKRVIGLPGDEIFVDIAGGFVYRNGEMLMIEEKDGLIFEDSHMINNYTHSGEFVGAVKVPDNSVYVLGDNRMNSLDSRSGRVGTINKNYIVGKVVLRMLPSADFGKVM